MPDVASLSSQPVKPPTRFSRLLSRARSESPSQTDCGLALISSSLLIVSFPNVNLWPLAWIALAPLFVLIARKPQTFRCFLEGWLFGSVFFYCTCYWLTYSMVHFGGIPSPLAFVMLLPGALVMGIFPATVAALLASVLRRWGHGALFLAPLFWVALEWARLETTGQLWNAIGYSQAYQPMLIGSARWAGVYGVGFLIVAVNTSLAFGFLKRSVKTSLITAGIVFVVALLILAAHQSTPLGNPSARDADATVIAIQPNVPMDLVKSNQEMQQLTDQHFAMTESALRQLPDNAKLRLVIWPESPMNFNYGTDSPLRDRLAAFAKANHTSILLNSQEVAPNDGIYNSALLINQEGRLVAQYDKIRLLPFGEYVPLPRWLPGAGLIRAIVGDFTPGTNYRLMPVGDLRAGVFICIESAYPSIPRQFTAEGADVLINISNDGYLGPTAVMRQHLANAIFRAAENDRPLLRVTNSGITAFITREGKVLDATQGFEPNVRRWAIGRAETSQTFYTRHGDLFVIGCAAFSLAAVLLSYRSKRQVWQPRG